MRKKQKHYLSIIIILILCITIGYAYLSSTLNGEITTVNIYPVTRKCQRAKTLHTETCSSSSTTGYCQKAGYTSSGSKKTTTITYGRLGSSGTLTVGDAFDCDVNGDGIFNDATERFYYVGSLSTNTTKVVLIYYNNVNAGVAGINNVYYGTSMNPLTGPVTAKSQLPTTSQWPKVSLNSTTRAIKNKAGTTVISSFSYSGYSARFITYQELKSACNTSGIESDGTLDSKCTFLFENSNFHGGTTNGEGFWLENQESGNPAYGYRVYVYTRAVQQIPTAQVVGATVKPVIEVSKSSILY